MKTHPSINVVGRRLRWAGQIQRMNGESLAKRAWKTEEGCRRRNGKPTLRWRDIRKRDIERSEMNSWEWERLEIAMDGDDL